MWLFYHPRSPYSRKVLFALAEKGLVAERRIVPPADWKTQAQLMGEVSPLGMTPVLELDDGTTLPESSIIVEHLDLIHPGPEPLVVRNNAETLEIRLFDRICDSYLIALAGQLLWQRRKPAAERSSKKIASIEERISVTLGILDRRLHGRPHLVGRSLSLADIAGCCGASILVGLDFPLAAWISVQEWYDALTRRSAWQAVLAETAEVTGSSSAV
ncbi:MAG: glutathione S-transferase family protein [Gammaproteobacteria bacterium]